MWRGRQIWLRKDRANVYYNRSEFPTIIIPMISPCHCNAIHLYSSPSVNTVYSINTVPGNSIRSIPDRIYFKVKYFPIRDFQVNWIKYQVTDLGYSDLELLLCDSEVNPYWNLSVIWLTGYPGVASEGKCRKKCRWMSDKYKNASLYNCPIDY